MIRHPLAALAVCLALASPASADLVTYDFTGTVTQFTGINAIQVPTAVGDKFTGSFTYDESSPITNPSPNYGFYNGALQSIDVKFPSDYSDLTVASLISGGSVTRYIGVDYHVSAGAQSVDSFAASVENLRSTGPFTSSANLEISLTDFGNPPTALTSNALQGLTLDLSKFPIHNLVFSENLLGVNEFNIGGTIDTLRLRSVPEPSSLALGAIGLTLAARARSRRRS